MENNIDTKNKADEAWKKAISQLMNGEIQPPNEICTELVQDARAILNELQKQERLITEYDRQALEAKAKLGEMVGAYNKTISDLQKWWTRSKDKPPKEKKP